MKTTKTAALKKDGDTLLVDTPYSEEIIAGIKDEDVIPRSERRWDKPIWRVNGKHLEYVRSLVERVSQEEGWQFLDYTSHSLEEIRQQKQGREESDMELHVAAVLAVLAKLPPRALRIVGWKSGAIQLELSTYLDDEDLFRAIGQASLDFYRPQILVPNPKRRYSYTLILADDERIMRALCDYAGTLSLDAPSYRSNVEYLIVRSVALVQIFPNNVAHFQGDDGSVWIGVPSQFVEIDKAWSRESWQVTIFDKSVYHLFERVSHLQKLIEMPHIFYSGFGVTVYPSYVASFIVSSHLEGWFREWCDQQLNANLKKAKWLFEAHRWNTSDWDHPVDKILSHISRTREGIAELLELLKWDDEFVEQQRLRIKQMKEQAVQGIIENVRQRSAELALPLLESKTAKDLLELAEKYTIPVKKSWSKSKLIETLHASQKVNEDIIGLTERLKNG